MLLKKAKIAAIHIYIFFCSLLMSLFATSNPFSSISIGDSAVYVYVAKVLIDGGMPYRDAFDHKGPLIYLIDAAGLLIDEKSGIWLIELLSLYITFLFAFKIIRLLKCDFFLSCLVVTLGIFIQLNYFQGGNLTEEYACAFITVSLYYFLVFFNTGTIRIRHIIICGISFSAVCMLRPNMIAVWVVMFSGVIFNCLSNRREEIIYQWVKWFITGILVIALPILVWIIANNAFDAFIEDYIIFNIMYSSDSKTAFNIIKTILFFIFECEPALMVSILFLFYFYVKQRKLEDWLCLVALLLSIIMACISGRKLLHYGMIFYPLIIYAIARVFSKFINFCNGSLIGKCIKAGIIPVCIIFIVGFVFLPWLSFLNKDVEEDKLIATLVQSVTSKDDKITVCGNNNTIYLLSNRKSSSRYSYQYPIADVNSGIWEEYLKDIKKLTTKVIVVLPGTYETFPYKQINNIINESYNLIGTVGKTKIYLLK